MYLLVSSRVATTTKEYRRQHTNNGNSLLIQIISKPEPRFSWTGNIDHPNALDVVGVTKSFKKFGPLAVTYEDTHRDLEREEPVDISFERSA